MLNKDIIEKKNQQIISYLNEISPVIEMDFDEYKSDIYKIRTLERNIQLIVDNMVDINNELIAGNNIEPADDYYNSFIKLEENNILSEDLTRSLAPLTGLRNRLVHEYEGVDQKILFDTIQRRIIDIKEYLRVILEVG
jgi:uncharacterized protein YutE (UPF0331/DUF86 family)